MSLTVSCSKCGKKYKVSDDKAGKKIRCPGCQAVISIPAAEIEDVPDEWELPPDEDDSDPPPGRTRTLSARGSKRTRAGNRKSGGKSSSVFITVIVLASLAGLSLLGIGGYFVVRKLVQNHRETNNIGPDGKKFLSFDMTTSRSEFDGSDFIEQNDGKYIQLRGVCSNFRGASGKQALLIGSAADTVHFSHEHSPGITVLREVRLQDQSAPFNTLFPGQIVTIRGTAVKGPPGADKLGVPFPPKVLDAEIIKVEGDPVPQVTEDEIGKAHETLSEGELDAKYTLGKCILTTKLERAGLYRSTINGVTTQDCEITVRPRPGVGKLWLSCRIRGNEPVDPSEFQHAVDPTNVKTGSRIQMLGRMVWKDSRGTFYCERLIKIE